MKRPTILSLAQVPRNHYMLVLKGGGRNIDPKILQLKWRPKKVVLHELQSKLLVSPLITPKMLPLYPNKPL